MPTYLNNTANHVAIALAGQVFAWAPGESKAIDYLTGDSRLTLTAATPYANDALAQTVPTSDGAEDDVSITLQAGTEKVEVVNTGDAIATVFRQAVANTPGLVVAPGAVRTIDGLKDRTSVLVLQFSAAVAANQVFVTEFK
ncbi:MAG: hypothetical protein V2B18_21315 [Pseudomonadota bacterium]